MKKPLEDIYSLQNLNLQFEFLPLLDRDWETEVYNAYQGYNSLHFTTVQVTGVQSKTTYGTAEIADNGNVRFIVTNPELLDTRPATIEFTYEIKNDKQQTATNKITLSLVLPDTGGGSPGGNGDTDGTTTDGTTTDGTNTGGDPDSTPGS